MILKKHLTKIIRNLHKKAIISKYKEILVHVYSFTRMYTIPNNF